MGRNRLIYFGMIFGIGIKDEFNLSGWGMYPGVIGHTLCTGSKGGVVTQQRTNERSCKVRNVIGDVVMAEPYFHEQVGSFGIVKRVMPY